MSLPDKYRIHVNSLDATESRLIERYRRMPDAARQELNVYARLLAELTANVPDNVVPFPQ